MTLVAWAARHRRSILFVVAVLALAGLATAWLMPVSLFPRVIFPRIVVSIDAGDRPADQMALEVTRPAETAVWEIPGLRGIRSVTSRGSAELQLNFSWGTDMMSAAVQVQSLLAQTLPQIDPQIRFTVRRMDPTVFPVAAYSLTARKTDLVRLRDLAEYELLPRLSAIPGVAQVTVLGGERAEWRIEVDPLLLSRFQIGVGDIVQALKDSNVLSVVGRIEDRHHLFLIIADSRFHDLTALGNVVLRHGPNGLVRLEDVARITHATAPHWTRVTADGRPAVLVQVRQQPGGNTIAIVAAVKKVLAEFARSLPQDVSVRQWYDQSELILSAAGSVRDAILLGILLAAGVIFAFLRSWRITLVVLIVVPAVIAGTVVVLDLTSQSFNIMTLGGMAAAIGLVIDDVVVLVEQIMRNLRPGLDAEGRRRVIRSAVGAYLSPLAGSSLATTLIFVPLVFLSGVTGAFFKAMSLTMAAALVLSFLVTWFAVPLLAEHLVGAGEAARERRAIADEGAWACRYRWLLAAVIARPGILLAAIFGMLAASFVFYRLLGSKFMPEMDEGGFVLDYRAPPGTSLAATDELLDQVERILLATPEVLTFSRRTGYQLGGGLTEANEGDFFVRLKPGPRRPIEDVMADVRRRIAEEVPALDIELAQLMEDLIGDLTAVPQPIEIKLFGDRIADLQQAAPRIARAIAAVPGVVEIRDGVVVAGDGLEVRIDPGKAALAGLDPRQVADQLAVLLAGEPATRVMRSYKLIDVRVWSGRDLRSRVEALARLPLTGGHGAIVPLGRVADIRIRTGQPQISRENFKPMVAVTARVEGRDMGSAVRAVDGLLKAHPELLPAGSYYRLGGLYAEQQQAFFGLAMVFVAATALVLLLLIYLYESLTVAAAIILMPLLAAAAVFVGLWVTGTALNISAMMGMTMVIGIVTEVAIFYFSELRHQHREQPDLPLTDALVAAGLQRLRPIAMTTIAALLALLPLALGLGQGAQMQQPLAIAIISGLSVQMPLVLVVMPGLYAALLRLHGRRRRSLSPGDGAA